MSQPTSGVRKALYVSRKSGGNASLSFKGDNATPGHRGVLFLDELGELPARLLDSLRQPLEDGYITIARRGHTVRFPSTFQLVAATNPCPCGFEGDRLVGCRCTQAVRDRYRRRFSGPLLDRLDLRVRVSRLSLEEMTGPPGEASGDVRARVAAARAVQADRGGLNRSMGRRALDDQPYSAEATSLLSGAIDRLRLSARGWDRVRRVARTISDLSDNAEIDESAVAEALAYRAEL